MARPGRLIAIEGADGSGKGTQARRLLRRLRREGRPADLISFPGYKRSFFGGLVGSYLRGELGEATALDPRVVSVLYACDRWQARGRILKQLDAGGIVICDRYVDSNKAHQAARLPAAADRRAFYRWVDRLEYGVLDLPRADLTIFLYVPTDVARELIGRKGRRAYLRGGQRDTHEADDGHLRRAAENYRELARRRGAGRSVFIECVEGGRLLGKDEVARRVYEAARSVLEEPPR